MYEFVQKLVKKKKPGWDFNPGPIWLAIVAVSAIHHPATAISGHFIYIPYNKNTIRKMRLYKFIRVTYVIPLLLRCLVGFCTNSERWKKAFRQNENIGGNAWAGPPE